MAETYTLDAQTRTITGKKVNQLRVQGLVPVVVYGAKRAPIHLQIPQRALTLTLLKAGGTHLINLNFDGATQMVITREVQRHVIRGDILHVDFLAVDATTRIRAEVPIHFINESPAVAARLGVLVTGTNYLTVEALPADLIQQVDVDLSGLTSVGDSIHVRDLKVGPNVTIENPPEEMLVRVSAPTAATEEPAEGEVLPSEPEVIAKGKVEEEDF